jgi:acyl-CoA synthetase (NDP forming)
MDLASVLRPRSIAVVGASPRTFIGRVAIENCRSLGFEGRLVPVNPNYPEIAGVAAVPALGALTSPPDVVLIQLATERVFETASAAAEAGARAIVVPGGGFTDSGYAATDLQGHLRRLATERDIAVIGPNCMGFVDLVSGAAPYIGTVPSHVRRGRVGIVAQSGAIVEAFINNGGRVPISTIVSCGAEAGTGLADYLRFFADDPETDAVLAFVEGFADPAGFLAAARRLAEVDKPLAVCKVGRSAIAQAGIAAHSGKLAGSARVAAAALRQVGAILCADLDELTTVGELFGTGRTKLGRRAHVVTNSGGEANLLADLAESLDIELPPMSEAGVARLKQRWPQFHVANPMDPWGTDEYGVIYPEALETAAAEPGDLLVMSIDQQTTCGSFEQQLGRDLAAYLGAAARTTGKTPVYLSPSSQDPPPDLAAYCHAERIPLLRGAWSALDAIAKVARRTDWPGEGLGESAAPIALPELEAAISRGDRQLDEDASLSAAKRYGVPVPRRAIVGDVDAAVEAAAEIGFPVVVKAVGPSIAHKSELGLVRVGLGTPDKVREAAVGVLARAREHGLQGELLVAEMMAGEIELIAGFQRDAQFGPTVLVGLGGIWTEYLDEVAVRIGRINRDEARRMLDETIVGRMLRTARGGAIPEEGVLDVICGLAALGVDHPDIAAFDLNPIIVGRQRTMAVDGLAVLRDRA